MIDLMGLDLIHVLATYGYLAVFLFVAIESTGVPIPGETMLLAASVYAGTTHRLDIALIILAAASGAILGDNIGYLLGREGGYRLLHRYGKYVRLDERKLRLGQYLFQQHGGKVVFFGRFLPILRIWAAFLAGAHRMSWRRFLAFNAAGGIVWVTVMGSLAYGFGSTVLRLGGPISAVCGSLGMLTMVIVAIVLHRSEDRLQQEADRALAGPVPLADAA